jgi:hypothetical protein
MAGVRLLPCGAEEGSSFAPVYEVADIDDFTTIILAEVRGAGKTSITPAMVQIDRTKQWSRNKVAPMHALRDGVLVIGSH